MRILGNIIWLIFGGVEMAITWYFAGIIMLLSIVGIPWVKSCFIIGTFCLWPFGSEIVDRKYVTGRHDIGTGVLGLIGNIIWILFGGFWLAIGHFLAALICFITIIGIPFGFQHLKLARLSFAPIGLTIVPSRI